MNFTIRNLELFAGKSLVSRNGSALSLRRGSRGGWDLYRDNILVLDGSDIVSACAFLNAEEVEVIP